MKSIIHSEAKTFWLTTDAWSSRTFKSYIAVTVQYISSNCKLRITLLEFKRFVTSHTGDALTGNITGECHSRV